MWGLVRLPRFGGAKAIGLQIPAAVLSIADEVIE
jgi:hypothetical protein